MGLSPMNSLVEYGSFLEPNPSPLLKASPYGSLRDLQSDLLSTPDVELTPMGSLVSLGHQAEEMLEVDLAYLQQEQEAHPIAKANSLPDFLNLQNIYVKIELFLQMEFAGLWSLKDFIRHNSRVIRKSEICAIIIQLLKGLIDIHAHGLIHRDLKPENVFIDRKSNPYTYCEKDELFKPHCSNSKSKSKKSSKKEVALFQKENNKPNANHGIPGLFDVSEWQLKIGDFGISKRDFGPGQNVSSPMSTFASDSDPDSTRGIGTWPYASPEQLEAVSGADICCKSDLFSLGVIMFELMVPPYTTEHERAVVIEALRRGIIPPTTMTEFPELSKVLRSLLAHNPDDRPSAKEALAIVKQCENLEFNDLMKNSKEWLAGEIMRLRERIKNLNGHSCNSNHAKPVKVNNVRSRAQKVENHSEPAVAATAI